MIKPKNISDDVSKTQISQTPLSKALKDTKIDMNSFNFFYQPIEACKKTFWQSLVGAKKNIFMMFVAALVFNFGIVVFLNRADTVPTGLMGFATLINLFTYNNGVGLLTPYLALIFWVLNIPLLLIFFKKVKRTFIVYTLLFMVFQTLINLVVLIPGVNWFLEQFVTIQRNWSIEEGWGMFDGKNLGGSASPILELRFANNWPIFIYGLMGGLFVSFGIALSWKFGGSTGGTDIIVYYFTTKSKREVGRVMSLVSAILTVLFLISQFSIKRFYLGENIPFISAQSISTLIYVLTIDIVVQRVYPKYKKVQLTIFTDSPEDVVAYFDHINYWHAYLITEGISGYTKKHKYVITTVVLLLEAKPLVRDLKKIAPYLWFSISPVRSTEGTFNTFKVD